MSVSVVAGRRADQGCRGRGEGRGGGEGRRDRRGRRGSAIAWHLTYIARWLLVHKRDSYPS